jgi:ABC-type molybdate transport system substrate-binding protein
MPRRAFHAAAVLLGVAIMAACSPAPQPSAPRVTPPPQINPTSPPLVPTLVPVPTATAAPLGRQTQDPTAVVVFAPSLFGQAFAELGSDFMLAAPEATGVSYRFDTSAMLLSLLQQGADADVFVALDRSSMDTIQQANLLDGPPSVFADDQIVIVTSKTNPQ